ncbi:hypothetical protein FLX35_10600, partial [Cylindrospermopsis raciborskii LB2897]|nr:hypothetical protein [Cylindrospermopsis raciborskii LB2897]
FLHENLIPGKLWVKPQGQFLGDFSLAEVARAQIRTALHQGTEIKQNANHNSNHNKSYFKLYTGNYLCFMYGLFLLQLAVV